ncbi:MAG TPA: BrnT family toxin [Pseudolabrys sp.]|nr:BrnT family toxin [Pseudolabrys sp.]
MEFEWDESKRAQVLEDRGLDFVDADLFFDGRAVSHQPTPRMEEDRWKTTAIIENAYFTLVWCWRGGKIRVITMRRAHEKEIRTYRQLHGH